mgnify:CR=1 FL=1
MWSRSSSCFATALLCLLCVWPWAAGAGTEPKHQTIKVAAYDLNPYVSAERAEHGYLYEIVARAFAAAGYKVEFEFYSPARAKRRVESGQADVLIPSYGSLADSDAFSFSQPIHGSQVGSFQLSTNTTPPSPVEELHGDDQESTPDSLFGEKDGVITSSSARIVQMVDMLAAGRMKVAVADKFQVADVLVNERPNLIGKVVFMGTLATKDFRVAVGRKNHNSNNMLDDFNRGLESIEQSGEYEQILMRYGYRIRASDDHEISVAAVGHFDMQILRDMSTIFTAAHPGTKIRWYLFEENLLRRTILGGLALNESVFDVVTIGNYDTPIYASHGWIEPLSPPPSYDLDDIWLPIRQSLSLNGELYALPFYGESSVTYYRKDLFEKAGLAMPEQPNYTQIESFARALHDPGNGVNGICLRGKPGWGESMAFITTMVNVFGGSWFDENGEPALMSEPWVKAVREYADLLGKYGPPAPYENGYPENLALFAGGHCAMWIDATVAASYLWDPRTSTVSNSTGLARAPVMSVQRGSHWFWTWALAVPKAAKNKTLAKEFVLWATSKEYIHAVARKKGWLLVPPGARFQSIYGAEPYERAAPFGRFVQGQIESAVKDEPHDDIGRPKSGTQFVSIPAFTAMGTSTGINIGLMLRKQLSVEQALELSEQEAKAIMGRSRLDGGAVRP